MKSFKTYLTEEKNLHMEHLEDNILNSGVEGARETINFLRSLRDMFAGHNNGKVDVTVKWDGAPAIFTGQDPRDGKFFVAKKGIFNKNPKMYKTTKEIDADLPGDLADKFKIALKEFAKLGIRGIIQGDLMFTKKTLKTQNFEGEKLVTFQPNTIVYGVPRDSELGRRISRAKIGVVWHTRYHGNTLEDMSASFTDDLTREMVPNKNVWFVDAKYRDQSGTATFTKKETKKITGILSQAGKLFRTIDAKVMNGIKNDPELLLRIKTFNNTKVKESQKISNPKRHTVELVDFIFKFYQKEIDQKKTDKGKAVWETKRTNILKFFGKNNQQDISKIFELMNLIVDAKELIIAKLDKVKLLDTLLMTDRGLEATGQEGFVAIDRIKGNAVKLVDRMQFSYANFSPKIKKGWER